MSELSHHNSPDHELTRRGDAATSIRRALDQGEFELWFQPKFVLSDHRILGAEGLARWRHPVRGIVAPDQFLPAVMRAGLLDRFTKQMLEQAVRLIAKALERGSPLEIAVNLAPSSFLEPTLAPFIEDLLDTYRVSGDLLVLELTEQDLLDTRDNANDAFAELRALGVKVSIDDFGTGYSSLSRLRRVPVDELKIDRSFVADLCEHEPDGMFIVRTIVELARLLEHQSVAEGIETSEQLAIVRSLGCTVGQGFWFSPAVEPNQLLTLATEGTHHAPPPVNPLASTTRLSRRPSHGHEPEGLIEGVTLASSSNDIRDALITDRQQLNLSVAMLDMLPCAAFVKDVNARIVQLNALARARLDVAPGVSVAGMTDFDVYDPADAARYLIDDRRVLASGQPQIDHIDHQRTPDGATRAVRITRVPVRNELGAIVGLVGFYTVLERTDL